MVGRDDATLIICSDPSGGRQLPVESATLVGSVRAPERATVHMYAIKLSGTADLPTSYRRAVRRVPAQVQVDLSGNSQRRVWGALVEEHEWEPGKFTVALMRQPDRKARSLTVSCRGAVHARCLGLSTEPGQDCDWYCDACRDDLDDDATDAED